MQKTANCNQPLADMSELLRIQQGDDQVTKQQDGQDERNNGNQVGVHGLPQLLACLDVEKRQDKEDCCEQQHPNILHGRAPGSGVEFQGRYFAGLESNAKVSVAQAQFDYQKVFLNKP
jgi:hypothetical protein